MPQFSVQATASVLGYVATILLIGGFVLLLAGLGILDIKAITIAKGRKTVVVGLLMILLGIGGLLFDIVSPPPPPTELAGVTFTPTATPAPPTFTPTSIPLPTATPVSPTDTPVPTSTPRPTATPVPPTDTPVPTDTPMPPTDTPMPIVTPQPTPTPTPTMDADPTVYDNFNNPANDGGYNEGLWRLWIEPPGGQYQIVQQNGVVMFGQQGRREQGIELAALKYYKISLERPTFFEARMMLSPEAKDSNVVLYLIADLPANEQWSASCAVCNWGEPNAGCMDILIWQEERSYRSEYIPHQLGSWHTVRMEVDPVTMTFSYFVDGQPVGSHIPLDADKLKKAKFTLAIGIWGTTADTVTGYVDDVRIGPVQ